MRRLTWLGDIAHHVIGCRLTRETGAQNASGDVASNIARHVIGCRLTREMGVQNASGDVASNIATSKDAM
jgi:hypothetical protein